MRIRKPRTLLVLLTGLNLLNYLDRMVLSAVLPKIEDALGLTHFVAGGLATVFLAGYFLTSPIFGTLGDRGRRTVLLAAGVALWSVATVASGLAEGTWSLVAARALVGVGEASYATIAPTIIDDLAPPDRKGRWLAIFYAASPIGSALGYFVGGLADRAAGWRSAFFVAGAPGLVLAGLCLLIVEPPRSQAVRDQPKTRTIDAARELLPIPLFRRGVLGYCAYTFAIGGFAYWAPSFLFRRYGMALTKANLIFGAITVLTGAVGTVLGGQIGDRAARRALAAGGGEEGATRAYLEVCALTTALAAPLCFLNFFAPGPTEFFLLAAPCELLLFMSTSPINAVFLGAVPAHRRASAMALAIFAIHLFGDLWSPPLIGKLADAMPIARAMLVVPVGFAVAAVIWWSRRASTTVGVAAVGVLGMLGCSRGTPAPVPVMAPPVPVAAASASAPIAHPLVFMEDDYPRALREAKARRVPIFVDTWAPWCHSCRSLRTYVLSDPALGPRQDEFVWLAIDTEKSENAAFTAKFPSKVLPTLFVLDAAAESVVVEWNGGLTSDELGALLDDARAGRPAAGGRALDAHVARLAREHQAAACLDRAAAEGPKLPIGTSRVNVAIHAASCAIDVKADPTPVIAELRVLTSAPASAPLLADDRSGAFEALVALHRANGATGATREVAREWATFLEGAAARARTPEERTVFDAHRLSAYLELGEPARALPMLEASRRDLPADYNPHARLARAYIELGRLDEAVAAADRALDLAYGPRKLRIYAQKADALKKKGDLDGARRTTAEAVAYAETLPSLSEGYKKLVADLRGRAK